MASTSAPPGASTSGSSASTPQHQRASALATLTPSPEQIKAARTLASQSQAQAAELVHVTGRAWRRWESGEREISGAAWELYLIKALGFTPIK
jgi:DNA-binding transcriptional regulator YiaG